MSPDDARRARRPLAVEQFFAPPAGRFAAARFAYAAGDTGTAARLAAAAVETRAGDWRRHYLYGRCLADLGRMRASRAALEAAARLAPERALTRVRLSLIEVYLHCGDGHPAADLIAMLKEIEPRSLELRVLQLKADLDANQPATVFDEARTLLAEGIALEEIYASLARAAVLSRRTAEVAAALEKGAELYPANSYLNEAVAHLASDDSQFVRALRHFEAALVARPENMALLFGYAYCLYETGDVELAFRVAAELKNSPFANVEIHRFYRQLEALVKR